MVVLITGSSSGIGETVARRLAEEGHQVVLMARRADLLEAVAGEINTNGNTQALSAPGDVGVWDDCARVVEDAKTEFGGIDAVINAAGSWVQEPLIEAGPEDIQRFVQTDVTVALLVTRATLPSLIESKDGRLIHINGLQGFIRQRPPVLYAAVESAVRGLCESLRWEAAPYGVHLGLITLGAVANTEPPTPRRNALIKEGRRKFLSRSEVADAVLFMLTRPHGVNIDEIVLTPLGTSL